MKESLYGRDKNLIFKETFNSQQAVERNGGVSNDVVYENGVGKFGGTAYIDYGEVNSVTSLTSNFSVRVKAKFDVDNTFLGLVCNQNSDLNGGWSIVQHGAKNKIALVLSNNSQADSVFADNELIIGKLYDIILVNKDNTTHLYLNGVLQIDTSSIVIENTERKLSIGRYYNNAGTLLHQGSIDLVEIYNKALTQEEVTNLYNKSTYQDIRDGLILDIDARGGVIEDKMGGELEINQFEVKRNNSLVCFSHSIHYGIVTPIYYTTPQVDFTINLWVKNDNSIPYNVIFGAGDHFHFSINAGNTRMRIAVNGTTTYASIGTVTNLCCYNMYTIIIDETGILKLFVNTSKIYQNDYGGVDFIMPLTFGRYLGTSALFGGYLNQMRFYNRALSATEITQLYSSQKRNYE